MHPLLKRQLKRLGLDDATPPSSLEVWQQLLERMSRSSLESDQGRELLERSITLSASEMQALKEQLRRTSESRLSEERDKLQTVLRSMGDGFCVVGGNWDIVVLNPEADWSTASRHHFIVSRRELQQDTSPSDSAERADAGTILPDRRRIAELDHRPIISRLLHVSTHHARRSHRWRRTGLS